MIEELKWHENLLASLRKVKYSLANWFSMKCRWRSLYFSKSRMTGVFILICVFFIWNMGYLHNRLNSKTPDIVNEKFVLPQIKDEKTIFLLRNVTNTPDHRFTRLHVIEEHHEALPLWLRRFYDAPDTHNPHLQKPLEIGKTALIHVDTHIDLGFPDVQKKSTMKRWPKKMSQLLELLQGNDRFITPPFTMGLVSDFLWLHPYWSEDTSYYFGHMFNGYVVLKSEFKLCSCTDKQSFLISEEDLEEDDIPASSVKIDPKSPLNTPYWNEYLKNDSLLVVCMVEKGNEEVILGPKDGVCELRTVVNFEIASEVVAANITMLLRKKAPFSVVQSLYRGFNEESVLWRLLQKSPNKPLSYILDIDEDYFGVEIPGWVLNRTGVNQKKSFDKVNARLATIFCSYDGAKTEHAFQTWFRQSILVNLFLKKWKCWETQKLECKKFSHALKAFKDAVSVEPQVQSWKCIKSDELVDERMEKVFKVMWKYFRRLNESQLIAIISMGTCMLESAAMSRLWQVKVEQGEGWEKMRSSSNQAELIQTLGMQICVGKNAPGSEYTVERKIENTTTLKEDMELLLYIMSKWNSQPSLITVCRSHRDGYVPRKWQKKIEATLFEVLKHVNFISSISQDVSYDNDLWHGPEFDMRDLQ